MALGYSDGLTGLVDSKFSDTILTHPIEVFLVRCAGMFCSGCHVHLQVHSKN